MRCLLAVKAVLRTEHRWQVIEALLGIAAGNVGRAREVFSYVNGKLSVDELSADYHQLPLFPD